MEPKISEGDSLSPVANITAGPMPSVGCMLIRFDFLSHPTQALEEAHPGRNYLLTPTQARDLATQIASALQTLSTTAPVGAAGPTH